MPQDTSHIWGLPLTGDGNVPRDKLKWGREEQLRHGKALPVWGQTRPWKQARCWVEMRWVSQTESCGRNDKSRDGADLKDSKTQSVTRFLKVGPFRSKITAVGCMLELACTGL